MRLLVVNVGSSSLKLRVLDDGDRTLVERALEWPPDESFPEAALDGLPAPDAVVHRVVHGGDSLRRATWVDEAIRAALAKLCDLAPLHMPRALSAIDALARMLPGTPTAACFDTAFHASLPTAAATYALPPEWPRRRYGFHGLSHAYASRRAAKLVSHPVERLRIVNCHLGAGASLAAVAGGRSVDTTMGFTPMDGLVMATRPGSVDPGLLLWLIEHRQLSAAELTDALEHRSGLAGLAGTGDMREVLAAADSGDESARTAIEVYTHRLRAGVASMAAAMGGLDALVFTGGVGEQAPAVRQAAAAGLGCLGIALDPERNAGTNRDGEIGDAGATVRTLVVTAREDLEMARQVRELAAQQAVSNEMASGGTFRPGRAGSPADS